MTYFDARQGDRGTVLFDGVKLTRAIRGHSGANGWVQTYSTDGRGRLILSRDKKAIKTRTLRGVVHFTPMTDLEFLREIASLIKR